MHILIIPSWYSSQENPLNGIFFREQANALQKKGYQVGIIYPERKSIKKFDINRITRCIWTENDQGLSTIRSTGWFWVPRMRKIQDRMLVNDGMDLFREYINKYGKPDIIHAHSIFNAGIIASKIKDKYGVPFIVTEHSSAYARGLIYYWQYKYLKKLYNNTSKIIVVSPELGDLLIERFECPKSIVEFIPNKVDTDFFQLTDTNGGDKTIFLTIGFLRFIKGHHILLDAFANKFKGKKDIELWVGGDGPERWNLENQVYDLGIESQVRFLGMLSREQVRDCIPVSDIFVLPSLYETFGVVLIEAMACGKPIIATKCGGPNGIVNNLNGILVPTNDVEVFADAMENMLGNIHRYNSKLIRDDCKNRFGEVAVISQLEQLYKDILH